ncbi:MAG: hypothetical protein HC904_08660 [Blastochloris sp.]|nr:hypothetical protein [Blastochloris sp.]
MNESSSLTKSCSSRPKMTLTEIKAALQLHGLRPLKSLGQNFLFDQNLCRQIVGALAPTPGSRVVEIGPGLGALTSLLLDLDLHLTALELDRGLSTYLRQQFLHFPNFQLIEGDAVQTLPGLPHCDALIGNLPYNASTPLIAALLERPFLPSRCVFTLQKKRATASPPNPGPETTVPSAFFCKPSITSPFCANSPAVSSTPPPKSNPSSSNSISTPPPPSPPSPTVNVTTNSSAKAFPNAVKN